MIDLEKKRKNIETIIKVALFPVIGFLVAPFIFLSIQGLLGLVVAGAISFVGINMIPWFAMKVANWRIKAIKHEAGKNPVETLQNDYQRRLQALGEFRESITKFHAEIGNFNDKLSDFVKKYPSEAEKFKMQLSKMQELLKLRERKYGEAQQNLREYDLEIKKSAAIWDMAQAAAEMNKAAGMSEDDFLAKIKVETAIDSVQKNLNLAFAELETSLMEESLDNDDPKQLNDRVIDVDSMKIASATPQKVKV